MDLLERLPETLDRDEDARAVHAAPAGISPCTIVPCSMESDSRGMRVCTGTRSVDEVDRRADDRVGVDSEVAIEILHVAGLSEVVDTEAGDRGAGDA